MTGTKQRQGLLLLLLLLLKLSNPAVRPEPAPERA
jgi:hypothetical protein